MTIMGTVLNRLYSDYLMPSRLRHYDALLQQARQEGYRQTSVRAWLAALRGGIKTVLIPQENEKDLADIPANIKDGLEIIPVSHVDQVLARALVAPLVPVEWTEADDLAAALPASIGGENGTPVTH